MAFIAEHAATTFAQHIIDARSVVPFRIIAQIKTAPFRTTEYEQLSVQRCTLG